MLLLCSTLRRSVFVLLVLQAAFSQVRRYNTNDQTLRSQEKHYSPTWVEVQSLVGTSCAVGAIADIVPVRKRYQMRPVKAPFRHSCKETYQQETGWHAVCVRGEHKNHPQDKLNEQSGDESCARGIQGGCNCKTQRRVANSLDSSLGILVSHTCFKYQFPAQNHPSRTRTSIEYRGRLRNQC